MNDLDNKILELFRYLINSGTRYIDKLDYSYSKIVYKLQGKEIILQICSFKEGEERKPSSYTKMNEFFKFKISPYGLGHIFWGIDTPVGEIGYQIYIDGKLYIVPELKRVEQAQVLDRIDDILEEMESNTLDSILEEFRANSREEF